MGDKFKSFATRGTKGITDLISYSPYTDGEWSHFAPAFPVTEEEYLADIESYQLRVIEKNEQYVAQLKEQGEYGKDFTTNFNFMTLPEFDEDKSAYDGKGTDKFKMDEWGIMLPLGNLKNSEKINLPEVKYWTDNDPRKYKEAQEIHDRLTLKSKN